MPNTKKKNVKNYNKKFIVRKRLNGKYIIHKPFYTSKKQPIILKKTKHGFVVKPIVYNKYDAIIYINGHGEIPNQNYVYNKRIHVMPTETVPDNIHVDLMQSSTQGCIDLYTGLTAEDFAPIITQPNNPKEPIERVLQTMLRTNPVDKKFAIKFANGINRIGHKHNTRTSGLHTNQFNPYLRWKLHENVSNYVNTSYIFDDNKITFTKGQLLYPNINKIPDPNSLKDLIDYLIHKGYKTVLIIESTCHTYTLSNGPSHTINPITHEYASFKQNFRDKVRKKKKQTMKAHEAKRVRNYYSPNKIQSSETKRVRNDYSPNEIQTNEPNNKFELNLELFNMYN